MEKDNQKPFLINLPIANAKAKNIEAPMTAFFFALFVVMIIYSFDYPGVLPFQSLKSSQ